MTNPGSGGGNGGNGSAVHPRRPSSADSTSSLPSPGSRPGSGHPARIPVVNERSPVKVAAPQTLPHIGPVNLRPTSAGSDSPVSGGLDGEHFPGVRPSELVSARPSSGRQAGALSSRPSDLSLSNLPSLEFGALGREKKSDGGDTREAAHKKGYDASFRGGVAVTTASSGASSRIPVSALRDQSSDDAYRLTAPRTVVAAGKNLVDSPFQPRREKQVSRLVLEQLSIEDEAVSRRRGGATPAAAVTPAVAKSTLASLGGATSASAPRSVQHGRRAAFLTNDATSQIITLSSAEQSKSKAAHEASGKSAEMTPISVTPYTPSTVGRKAGRRANMVNGTPLALANSPLPPPPGFSGRTPLSTPAVATGVKKREPATYETDKLVGSIAERSLDYSNDDRSINYKNLLTRWRDEQSDSKYDVYKKGVVQSIENFEIFGIGKIENTGGKLNSTGRLIKAICYQSGVEKSAMRVTKFSFEKRFENIKIVKRACDNLTEAIKDYVENGWLLEDGHVSQIVENALADLKISAPDLYAGMRDFFNDSLLNILQKNRDLPFVFVNNIILAELRVIKKEIGEIKVPGNNNIISNAGNSSEYDTLCSVLYGMEFDAKQKKAEREKETALFRAQCSGAFHKKLEFITEVHFKQLDCLRTTRNIPIALSIPGLTRFGSEVADETEQKVKIHTGVLQGYYPSREQLGVLESIKEALAKKLDARQEEQFLKKIEGIIRTGGGKTDLSKKIAAVFYENFLAASELDLTRATPEEILAALKSRKMSYEITLNSSAEDIQTAFARSQGAIVNFDERLFYSAIYQKIFPGKTPPSDFKKVIEEVNSEAKKVRESGRNNLVINWGASAAVEVVRVSVQRKRDKLEDAKDELADIEKTMEDIEKQAEMVERISFGLDNLKAQFARSYSSITPAVSSAFSRVLEYYDRSDKREFLERVDEIDFENFGSNPGSMKHFLISIGYSDNYTQEDIAAFSLFKKFIELGRVQDRFIKYSQKKIQQYKKDESRAEDVSKIVKMLESVQTPINFEQSKASAIHSTLEVHFKALKTITDKDTDNHASYKKALKVAEAKVSDLENALQKRQAIYDDLVERRNKKALHKWFDKEVKYDDRRKMQVVAAEDSNFKAPDFISGRENLEPNSLKAVFQSTKLTQFFRNNRLTRQSRMQVMMPQLAIDTGVGNRETLLEALVAISTTSGAQVIVVPTYVQQGGVVVAGCMIYHDGKLSEAMDVEVVSDYVKTNNLTDRPTLALFDKTNYIGGDYKDLSTGITHQMLYCDHVTDERGEAMMILDDFMQSDRNRDADPDRVKAVKRAFIVNQQITADATLDAIVKRTQRDDEFQAAAYLDAKKQSRRGQEVQLNEQAYGVMTGDGKALLQDKKPDKVRDRFFYNAPEFDQDLYFAIRAGLRGNQQDLADEITKLQHAHSAKAVENQRKRLELAERLRKQQEEEEQRKALKDKIKDLLADSDELDPSNPSIAALLKFMREVEGRIQECNGKDGAAESALQSERLSLSAKTTELNTDIQGALGLLADVESKRFLTAELDKSIKSLKADLDKDALTQAEPPAKVREQEIHGRIQSDGRQGLVSQSQDFLKSLPSLQQNLSEWQGRIAAMSIDDVKRRLSEIRLQIDQAKSHISGVNDHTLEAKRLNKEDEQFRTNFKAKGDADIAQLQDLLLRIRSGKLDEISAKLAQKSEQYGAAHNIIDDVARESQTAEMNTDLQALQEHFFSAQRLSQQSATIILQGRVSSGLAEANGYLAKLLDLIAPYLDNESSTEGKDSTNIAASIRSCTAAKEEVTTKKNSLQDKSHQVGVLTGELSALRALNVNDKSVSDLNQKVDNLDSDGLLAEFEGSRRAYDDSIKHANDNLAAAKLLKDLIEEAQQKVKKSLAANLSGERGKLHERLDQFVKTLDKVRLGIVGKTSTTRIDLAGVYSDNFSKDVNNLLDNFGKDVEFINTKFVSLKLPPVQNEAETLMTAIRAECDELKPDVKDFDLRKIEEDLRTAQALLSEIQGSKDEDVASKITQWEAKIREYEDSKPNYVTWPASCNMELSELDKKTRQNFGTAYQGFLTRIKEFNNKYLTSYKKTLAKKIKSDDGALDLTSDVTKRRSEIEDLEKKVNQADTDNKKALDKFNDFTDDEDISPYFTSATDTQWADRKVAIEAEIAQCNAQIVKAKTALQGITATYEGLSSDRVGRLLTDLGQETNNTFVEFDELSKKYAEIKAILEDDPEYVEQKRVIEQALSSVADAKIPQMVDKLEKDLKQKIAQDKQDKEDEEARKIKKQEQRLLAEKSAEELQRRQTDTPAPKIERNTPAPEIGRKNDVLQEPLTEAAAAAQGAGQSDLEAQRKEKDAAEEIRKAEAAAAAVAAAARRKAEEDEAARRKAAQDAAAKGALRTVTDEEVQLRKVVVTTIRDFFNPIKNRNSHSHLHLDGIKLLNNVAGSDETSRPIITPQVLQIKSKEPPSQGMTLTVPGEERPMTLLGRDIKTLLLSNLVFSENPDEPGLKIFGNASLHLANITNCTFRNCDLSEVKDIKTAKFNGCKFENCHLPEINDELKKKIFTGCTLSNTDEDTISNLGGTGAPGPHPSTRREELIERLYSVRTR